MPLLIVLIFFFLLAVRLPAPHRTVWWLEWATAATKDVTVVLGLYSCIAGLVS